jgi:hypothetical protein
VKFYEASASVAATPQSIWRILTDAAGYASWDSGLVRVEGRVALGEKLLIVNRVDPSRGFPARVVEFEPERRMVWSGGMPLGLFTGARAFTLTPEPGGQTRVLVREEYRGPLISLVWKSMPDLGPSFRQFVSGLKAKAEAEAG